MIPIPFDTTAYVTEVAALATVLAPIEILGIFIVWRIYTYAKRKVEQTLEKYQV